jgi:hypothetical protein
MKRGTLDHKEMGLLKKTKEEEVWGSKRKQGKRGKEETTKEGG